jgi:membrane-associated phospholipid phosphatase
MNQGNLKHLSLMLVMLLMFLLFMSSFSETVFASEGNSEDRLNKIYLKNFKNDFVSVCTSPASWKKKDYLVLSAVLGTGAILYIFDEDIYSWVQERKNPSSNDFSYLMSSLGNGLFLGGLITALYSIGEFSNTPSLRKTALLSMESWLTSGVVVLSLKFLIGRARPYTREGSTEFRPFSTGSDHYSFPSGHATSAFAVASVIAGQSDSKFVDILVYSLASMAAVSRVHDRKHWPSDVFIGSVLGYVVGKAICRLNSSRGKNRLDLGLQLSPYRQGITISYNF